MRLHHYLEALLGLLYPQERSCVSCREPLPEAKSAGNAFRTLHSFSDLCRRCLKELVPIQPPYCLVCGRHIPVPGRCPECIRDTSFSCSRSFGQYNGVLRELLHRFKFSREEQLLSVLSACLNQAWDLHFADFSLDWIVPVPAHPERIKERGYNQAERLGCQLSSYSQIPLLSALQRDIHLKGQATRDRSERLKALRGVYRTASNICEKVADKQILLVDDIYTTGSTAEACSEVLLDAGAKRVFVLTVAR
jgi:ComF family protein